MPNEPALCVDLDGTILKTDSLHEALVLLLKRQPGSLPALPFWLLQGKAKFKQKVAERTALNVETLPVNQAVIAWLREEQSRGRRIVLATGTNVAIASAVARRFSFFSDIMASDGVNIMSGQSKARALVERFGKGNFDYAGNASVDLAIWAVSRKAIVVNAPESLTHKAAKLCTVERVVERKESPWRELMRALRPHQWSKNFLLFLPVCIIL